MRMVAYLFAAAFLSACGSIRSPQGGILAGWFDDEPAPPKPAPAIARPISSKPPRVLPTLVPLRSWDNDINALETGVEVLVPMLKPGVRREGDTIFVTRCGTALDDEEVARHEGYEAARAEILLILCPGTKQILENSVMWLLHSKSTWNGFQSCVEIPAREADVVCF